MRFLAIGVLILAVLVAANTEESAVHLAEQHLGAEELHNGVELAHQAAKPSGQAKTNPKAAAPAKGKDVNSAKAAKATPATPATAKGKSPAKAKTSPNAKPAAQTPKANAKTQAKNPKVTAKTNSNSKQANPKKISPQAQAPNTKTKVQTETPATSNKCFYSVNAKALAKLQTQVSIKTKGKVSCGKKKTCFVGIQQLHKYLQATKDDAKCICPANPKKGAQVKCQLKPLTGLDRDDNPLHIYYRIGSKGQLNLVEIKSVSIVFKAEENNGKVGWGVVAAYPA